MRKIPILHVHVLMKTGEKLYLPGTPHLPNEEVGCSQEELRRIVMRCLLLDVLSLHISHLYFLSVVDTPEKLGGLIRILEHDSPDG